MDPVFEKSLMAFVAHAQSLSDAWMESYYPNAARPVIGFDKPGPRFVRMTKTQGDPANPVSRSVYAFVDMTDGSILKTSSWAAPTRSKGGALAVRGNVYDEATWSGFTWNGPKGRN
jgi:hypothetical protein